MPFLSCTFHSYICSSLPASSSLGQAQRKTAPQLVLKSIATCPFRANCPNGCLMRDARNEIIKDPSSAFTGLHQDTLQDDYDYDQGLAWRVERPLPATIAATGANLSTQDQ